MRESLGEFNYRYNILSKCVSHVLSVMALLSGTTRVLNLAAE